MNHSQIEREDFLSPLESILPLVSSEDSLSNLEPSLPEEVWGGIENEDGSITYSVGQRPDSEQEKASIPFDANLAEILDEDVLKRIATKVYADCLEDLEARKNWIDDINKVKQYLGFSIEDRTPDDTTLLTKVFDTTFSSALIHFYAMMRSEFLPDGGPAHIKELTDENTSTELLSAIKNYLNEYLTLKDKGYYRDFERAILYLGLYGSIFKKIFFDRNGYPISRFIDPNDFIINLDCVD